MVYQKTPPATTESSFFTISHTAQVHGPPVETPVTLQSFWQKTKNVAVSTWNWMLANKLKTLIILLVIAGILALVVEFARGVFTPYLIEFLTWVHTLGAWVGGITWYSNCMMMSIGYQGPVLLIVFDALTIPILMPAYVGVEFKYNTCYILTTITPTLGSC